MIGELTKNISGIILFGCLFIYFIRGRNGWLHKHSASQSGFIIKLKKVTYYLVLTISGFFLFVSTFDLFIVIAGTLYGN